MHAGTIDAASIIGGDTAARLMQGGMTGRERSPRRARRWALDGYSLSLIATVALATVLPARGSVAAGLSLVTSAAIALLFFLHGARLSREVVMAGLTHWRLHLMVLGCTYMLFPAAGLLIQRGAEVVTAMTPALATGFLFLALLPSTVQSSIAFTSIARGNVTAAVCTAAASNLIGTLLTPALVALLIGIHGHGGDSGAVVRAILLQLLAPFVAGQMAQPLVGQWFSRHRLLVTATDRGSILLVVYGAFSAAILRGLFSEVPPVQMALVFVVACALLALIITLTSLLAARLGFSHADRMAILFCGSTKSLASGVPMAGLLFPPALVGVVILPLMVFHQIQLLVCAQLARRFAIDADDAAGQTGGGTKLDDGQCDR